MTQKTRTEKGQYWDKAWSLVEGCSPASEGCLNCWAAALAHMRQNHPHEAIRKSNTGLTTECGAFNGAVRFRRDLLAKPLKVKKPTTWAIWTDLFCDWPGSYEDRQLAFIVMSQAPQHTFLILTKRPQRMKTEITDLARAGNTAFKWPLKNVWLGVTAENQKQADQRIPFLLATPSAHRFVSVEPMLEPMELRRYLAPLEAALPMLDWVVCGPETGRAVRPCKQAWIEDLHNECKFHNTPFFNKNKSVLSRDLPF